MALDFETRKKYYNICDPYEPLEPIDPRHVNLDEHFVRGLNWVDRLVGEVALSSHPICKLFTGHRGSGKTTELKLVAKQLSRSDKANLFSVFIKAEEVIDLRNAIDVPDIICAVIYSIKKAVADADGVPSENVLNEGYFKRLWDSLLNTDAEFSKIEFSVPMAAKLVFEMKMRPMLRDRIRKTIAPHLSDFIKKANEELQMLNSHVQRAGKAGIVVIFDDLEKLMGITSTWHDVLESAERVFVENEAHIRLPVHVIYMVPPSLAARRVVNADFLPMIKVIEKNREPSPAGVEAALELIRKRVPDEVLSELFENAPKEQLKKIIHFSGGYPREIVEMVQKCFNQDRYPLSDKYVQRIITEVANRYRIVVSADAFQWLAQVAISKFLTIQNDEHRRIADRMLSDHAVLHYLNDEVWDDIHPAVAQIPGVQEAIHELEHQSTSGITS